MGILSVAGDGDEIEGDLSGNASRKIGEKKHATLQDAHQMQRFIRKISSDLLCYRLNAPLNAASGDQDFDALSSPACSVVPDLPGFGHQGPRMWKRDCNVSVYSGARLALITFHFCRIHILEN
jgi:hypothetical protein